MGDGFGLVGTGVGPVFALLVAGARSNSGGVVGAGGAALALVVCHVNVLCCGFGSFGGYG